MEHGKWETVRYEDLEPELRTGDLFLFHGDSRRSHAIEDVTRSEFSHIGMIVRRDSSRPPLIWQSDPRPVTEDLDVDQRHGGAQLNDLSAAIAVMTRPGYGDTPFVRHLIIDRTPEFEDRVLEAIGALDGTPFPSLLKIVHDWVLGHLHIATSDRDMYCGEVLASTYQRIGLLPDKPPANAYSPRDFSEQHEHISLQMGARLGPQRQVLWAQPAPARS